MLDIPLTKKEMEAAILKTIRANELSDAYIRVVVSRGEGDLGLDPRKCSEPTVVIIASAIQLYPEELYKTGLKLVTVPTRRNGPEMVNPRIKSLNYLNNIMARIEANQQGAPEAIILNTDGYVAECTGDNIFIIEEDTITTPPRYAGILKGTKREIVLAAAAEMGLEVKEELFTRHDLFNADECFLSGTAAEAIPVVEVDGRVIADGSVGEKTKAIIARFREIAQTTGTEIYND
jgi:branched-chain amino acid aminotransferase